MTTTSHHTIARMRTYLALTMGLITLLCAQTAFAGDWTSFRGSSTNNAVTKARTPRAASEVSLKWALSLKPANDWQTNVGSPLIVGNQLIVPVGQELRFINKETKAVEGRVALAATIDSTSRPVYSNDVVYVPESDGRIEAISTAKKSSLWATDSIETTNSAGKSETYQSLSTPLLDGGKLYVGATVADWSSSYRGNLRCIDVSKDTTNTASRIVWEKDNLDGGYYWSGAIKIGKAIVVAGDDGIVTSLDAATGNIIEEKPMGKNIVVRSSVVSYNNNAVFTTKDGRLFRIAINSDGTFGKGAWSKRFAVDSTVTPAIYNNLAFVGGKRVAGYQDKTGVYCAIDLNTMEITRSVVTPYVSQSSALISSVVSGNPIAYFSMNNKPGGVYGISLKSGATPMTFFEPTGEMSNYCLTSFISDDAGTLYHINDSGYLMALKTTVPKPKSADAAIKSVSKTTGTWKSSWSKTRVNPRYTKLLIGRTKSSVKLTANKNNNKATVYMRLSGQSYKKVNSINVKLARGKQRTAFIKCVAENGTTAKTYRVIVNRRK